MKHIKSAFSRACSQACFPTLPRWTPLYREPLSPSVWKRLSSCSPAPVPGEEKLVGKGDVTAMMALQLKNGDAAYYQSAEYCRNYTSAPVSYGDSSHYLNRLPGKKTSPPPPCPPHQIHTRTHLHPLLMTLSDPHLRQQCAGKKEKSHPRASQMWLMTLGCMGSAVITISSSSSSMPFNRVATSITALQCADTAMQSKVVKPLCKWSLALEEQLCVFRFWVFWSSLTCTGVLFFL